MSVNLDSSLGVFIDESRELLTAMESALLLAEQGECGVEDVNAMFRAAHTIKGSAGLFGFSPIVAFTHVVENVLDKVRSQKLSLDGELISLVLDSCDHMRTLVDGCREMDNLTPDIKSVGENLLQRLQSYTDAVNQVGRVNKLSSEASAERLYWHISMRFADDIFRNGMDPLSILRYLGTLGEIKNITVVDDHLPEAEKFDPETSYLGFELDVLTNVSKDKLESVFDFVREGSQIRIIPPNSKIEQYIELIKDLPEADDRIGELLIKSGVITELELKRALETQQNDRQLGGQKLGAILESQEGVPPSVIHAAVEKQKAPEEKRAQSEARFVKTDANRLDKLVNLIGELVIANAASTIAAQKTGDVAVLESNEHMTGLIEQIRDTTLTLRMVPIGETFQRFRRVVRDVSKELGKSIDLIIEGADTEMDRTMVDKLNDPLTHIVRNSMDHGIESIERRRYAGKPETGKLKLNAFHEGGSIVIEISDDGGGLNRTRILQKAIEKGLIGKEANLSDRDIDQLIFAPGFSTAETVTNLSGRGVGMDVVRRNIDDLRGTIEIESEPGQGTRIRIRLPLTLAIIDGLHVKSADANFVLPLSQVVECLDWREISANTAHQNCFDLRGEVLPVVKIRDLFQLEGPDVFRQKVVVVEFAGKRAGFVVDELLGELQTVIKPLGQIFKALQGIGGSTILGTGEVALIIDVAQLVNVTVSRESSTFARLH